MPAMRAYPGDGIAGLCQWIGLNWPEPGVQDGEGTERVIGAAVVVLLAIVAFLAVPDFSDDDSDRS